MVAARKRTEPVRTNRTRHMSKRRPNARVRKAVSAARRPTTCVAPETEALRQAGAPGRQTCSRATQSVPEPPCSAGTNRTEQLRHTTNRVPTQLAQIALADIGEAFDAQGAVIPFTDLPASVRSAVAEYRVRQHRNGSRSVGVVMRPKLPVLAVPGHHLGAFNGPEQVSSRLVLAPTASQSDCRCGHIRQLISENPRTEEAQWAGSLAAGGRARSGGRVVPRDRHRRVQPLGLSRPVLDKLARSNGGMRAKSGHPLRSVTRSVWRAPRACFACGTTSGNRGRVSTTRSGSRRPGATSAGAVVVHLPAGSGWS